MPQVVPFLPAIIGAAGSIIGAKKSASGAQSAAQATVPVPYGSTGPAGIVGVNKDTKQLTFTQGDNPFASIFNALGMSSFANAAVAPGQFLNGANPEVAAAYKGMFGQGLTGEIQDQLGLLRQAAAPEEARQSQGLDDQLFSRGMLGTSGGAERFRALEEAQGSADLQRQLAAIGLGQQNAGNRFQAAMGATGQGMAGQLQNFNIGQGSFGGMQQLLQNLFDQARIGVGAGGGQAPGAAMMSAQAQGAPFQAGFNFLNQSGAFDALGRAISGPQITPPQFQFGTDPRTLPIRGLG
jgi:hypothetical protein